jgi:hypothetical protein
MATVEYVFPAPCPECRTLEGLPVKAQTMANGGVCVTLRCRLCRHEWELALSNEKIALGPKADRRHPQKLASPLTRIGKRE